MATKGLYCRRRGKSTGCCGIFYGKGASFMNQDLTAGKPEAVLRRFCLEVEHSQPNLDALQDALWHPLTLPDLLSLA